MAKWQQLMDLLEKKKKLLMGFSELLGMFREIESIGIEMSEMEVSRFILEKKICKLCQIFLIFYYYGYLISNFSQV